MIKEKTCNLVDLVECMPVIRSEHTHTHNIFLTRLMCGRIFSRSGTKTFCQREWENWVSVSAWQHQTYMLRARSLRSHAQNGQISHFAKLNYFRSPVILVCSFFCRRFVVRCVFFLFFHLSLSLSLIVVTMLHVTVCFDFRWNIERKSKQDYPKRKCCFFFLFFLLLWHSSSVCRSKAKFLFRFFANDFCIIVRDCIRRLKEQGICNRLDPHCVRTCVCVLDATRWKVTANASTSIRPTFTWYSSSYRPFGKSIAFNRLLTDTHTVSKWDTAYALNS